jgi:hypothetical protein
MVLPFDPLRRKWLDLGPTNPGLIDELRPLLVVFIAFDRDRKATALGSGIITAASKGVTVALTARHVMAEGAVSAQKPHLDRSGGFFREFRAGDHLSLHRERLKVCWMGQKNAAFLDVLSTNFNDYADLQGCFLAARTGEEAEFLVDSGVSIDLRPVQKGEVVYQLSCGDISLIETQVPIQKDGAGQVLKIKNHVSLRVGTVTNVFPQGRPLTKGPAFETSIPSSPGMSGGAVLRIEDNRPSICGIISSDFSVKKAHVNFFSSGSTAAMMVWPTLALKLITSETAQQTWFDAMQRGVLPMPIGGLEGFKLNESVDGTIEMTVPADQFSGY